METTHQYNTRRRKNSIDRLSALPDSVLCHILSFLPTKISGRTSILARRWRYLWSYVLTLDFKYIQYPDIINRVMLLHRVYSLNTFRITHWIHCSYYQMETWIAFAIARNVKNIDISLKANVNLPRCIFTCKTLVDLTLDSCGPFPISGPICLPRLKKLHLISPNCEGEESLPHLLSGCPVLEDLLICCHFSDFVCRVNSPTVKRLEIHLVSNGYTSNMVEINTPSLGYLWIRDSYSGYVKSAVVMTSLIEADINIFSDNEQDSYNYSRLLLDFIGRLCNVKRLKLDLSDCTAVIESVFAPWTMSFDNLTKLELTADCRFLSKFLELADNLEILIFTEEFCPGIQGWMEPPQKVPACLLSKLRVIKLVDIRGIKHEFEIIRFLLRNAKVLERMEIECGELVDSEKQVSMLKKISKFQRGSSHVKLSLFGMHKS